MFQVLKEIAVEFIEGGIKLSAYESSNSVCVRKTIIEENINKRLERECILLILHFSTYIIHARTHTPGN